MASLKAFLASALLVWAATAEAEPIDAWTGYISEASSRFGLPSAWIREVMRAESGGRTSLGGQPITSRTGAMGLMQLMPRTWAEMRNAYGLGDDPYDAHDNVIAGAAYLRAMYDRFGYPGLFAAYNAGPSRYRGHLASGRKLPVETVAYVDALTQSPTNRETSATWHKGPQATALFAVQRDHASEAMGLFAIRLR